MTEKRYYQRDYEELYYILDSQVISEKDFDERVEYDGYNAFEDSLTGEEIVGLLNENEQLKQQLADIDRLIYDLGHDEMRRQYEEIFKGDVE